MVKKLSISNIKGFCITVLYNCGIYNNKTTYNFSINLGNNLIFFSDWPITCPEIVSREKWRGKSPIAVEYTVIPVKTVIVHHTVTDECNSLQSCSELVQSIQNFHMENLEFHDIGYK